ncbi:hypothetical protein PMAYCL1PPCAC_16776, partial [Pristionchus mayeri]
FSMRLLVVLLLIGSVAAQKAQFQTKFENLVTKYLGKNTGSTIDMIGNEVYNEKTIEQMMKTLMDNILKIIPGDKYISGLNMINVFTSCLKKAGSDMEKGMAMISAAFKAKLTPLYNTVMKKVKTMKKNGKPQAAVLTEGYKIATAGLTKKLVQSIINECMKKSIAAEYACALGPLKTVLQAQHYNLVYDKARG